MILDHLAYDYRKKNEYVNSLKTIQQSLKIKENIGETYTLSSTYSAFGSLYLRKRDSVKARSFFDKALRSAKKYNNVKDIAYILNLYTGYYNTYEDYETGKMYAEEAYRFSDSIGYGRMVSYALNNLSRYERQRKNYDLAIQYSKRSLELSIDSDDKISSELSYKNLGYSYRKIGQPTKAIYYYEKSLNLVKELGFEGLLANRYLSLSNAHNDLKQYELAFSYYRLYKRQQIKDLNVEKIKEFTQLDIEYKYEKERLKDSLSRIQEKRISESKIETLSAKNKIKNQWIFFGGISLITLFLIIYLIRSQKFAISKQILQEQFSRDLIKGQEKERSRLARELHDSVGQKLMLLSKTTKNSGNENAEQLASSTLEEVRSISRGLHPSNLERLGLTEAINALVYDINVNTELFFTEDIDNIDNVLSKESELHLYRIIQESLNNIIKHAEAKAVELHVNKTKENIEIAIKDNGKGFDFESKYQNMSLGLKTLFERAKIINTWMNIESNLGEGTRITLSVPVKQE